MTVLSPLGQPLNAEIEIVALRPGEEEGLQARVAPREAYASAGMEVSATVSQMRFTVERRDGRRILRVTTREPVNEPFVEFLVELQWGTGRLVREYTFLLDPPEYKSRDTLAAAPLKAPTPKPAAPAAPAEEMKPAAPPPAVEAKPLETPPPAPVIVPAPTAPSAEPAKEPAVAEAPREPAREPAKEPAQEPAKEPAKDAAAPAELVKEPAKPEAAARTHEVKPGDTLGKIASANLPAGVTLNQMLIALYRANPDAFIRENVNLVRAGRILNIPSDDEIREINAGDANQIVRTHMAEFREYRSRLAAVAPAADAAPGQREAPAGRIEPKPEAPKPAAPQDQVRLSKVDPQKPAAPGAQAARGDDLVARERALKEAQSRIADLEKNVADLQKLLQLKNQQLAELEKKAAAKPEAPKPAAPAPAPAAKAPEAPKPAAPAPAPAAKAPEAPKPAAPAPTPTPAPAAKAPEAPKPAAPAAKAPAAKPAAKAAPETGLLDEFLANPLALGGLGAVLLLLLGYGAWAWRKKKAVQARFQDSVAGAAAAGAAAGAAATEPTLGASTPPASQPAASQPPAAMAAEEVDPIAEADVYMAYGRDSQAEEILKEALQKDATRVPVQAKLLEIYAKRKDAKAFEQAALKLKNLTNGAGPEWEKAASLGHSIDPQNGLYAGAAATAAAAAPAAAAPAAAAPTLDFDIGGAAQASASAPDLTLDAAPKAADSPLDFDVSGAGAAAPKQEVDHLAETAVVPDPATKPASALDFNLDLGNTAAPAEKKPEPAPAAADAGLSFDLNLDLGGDKKPDAAPAAAAPDLSTISLDLGSPAAAPAAGTDPKWQEIATKLDLAKAYEEMGDKNGARELLNEVMKDGDAAQKGQAQQLLAKLG